jgi:acyl carrier protein
MVACSYCGKENDQTVTHCSECGTELSRSRIRWFSWQGASEAQERRDHLFAGREPFDDLQLWQVSFKEHGVGLETVVAVRFYLAKMLKTDVSRLRDTDDLAQNFDSLNRLELVQALENHFRMTFSDSEVAAIRNFKDIVLTVHAKLPNRHS